ncbi:hypothetical protein EDC30_102226 [Paucimonas lemoignei]|uniref:Peptidase n=1 Tax=Paucimonas lemoignei TaxID=29443 RepID=A0A4R3HYN9_PAULE|nr:hypothetical protein [Paucimonas lemoignei]TCS38487.1 hypothetical protein EDC30_102226 [Paucimonas lemoignei]
METTKPTDMKPIEIFKPGTYVAMNGQKYTFTPADVRQIAETYNPEFADAPYVVGHPKLTSPRYGRAGGLFINDAGILCAESADVVPEFAEAVNAKLYPKVSASIYMPDAPGNPTPGKYYLRHVGFLGGQPPAVKGLKSVEFAAEDEGVANFAYEDRLVVRMFRRLRDWITSKEGAEAAEEVISNYDLDFLTESAVREELAESAANPGFSSPNLNQEDELNATQIAERESALAAQQAELDARAARVAAAEAKLKKAGFVEFAEGLCNAGKLLPAQKDSVVEILVQLDETNKVADFAEGDANHGKTGAELFQAFLSSQPKLVEFGRLTPSGDQNTGTADFAAPPGAEVDQAGMELYAKAQTYMKEHPGTEFMDAVQAVQNT